MKIFLLILTLALSTFAQADNYPFIKDKRVRQIKLLKSTQTNVEKLYEKQIPFRNTLMVNGGGIVVLYSSGKCDESTASNWNVAEGIVTGIIFYPSKNISFDSLKRSLSAFKFASETTSVFSYSNDKLGVRYEFEKAENSSGLLISVEYYPSNKFKNLSCSQIKGSK